MKDFEGNNFAPSVQRAMRNCPFYEVLDKQVVNGLPTSPLVSVTNITVSSFKVNLKTPEDVVVAFFFQYDKNRGQNVSGTQLFKK